MKQRRLTKLLNTSIKSIDEENRRITFCFSDNAEDRMGEVVDQASWQTSNYMANPLILWGHNPDERVRHVVAGLPGSLVDHFAHAVFGVVAEAERDTSILFIN